MHGVRRRMNIDGVVPTRLLLLLRVARALVRLHGDGGHGLPRCAQTP